MAYFIIWKGSWFWLFTHFGALKSPRRSWENGDISLSPKSCTLFDTFFIGRRLRVARRTPAGEEESWWNWRGAQKAQYGGAQRRWRRVVLCVGWVRRERTGSGTTSPWGAGFFQTIPRRLIASVDLYFHFFGLCLVLGQNSLSLHVMWMWILSSKTQHVIRAGWSKHVVQE